MNRAFFLFLLILAVSACAPQQGVNRPLYSGSDGVKISFPSSNALKQYQNDTFTVAVRLENDGAFDVLPNNPGFITATFDPAIIALKGFRVSSAIGDEKTITAATKAAGCDPESGASSACSAFAVRGRTQYLSVGEIAFAEFTFTAKPLADSRQSATTPLSIQACYPYTTTFIANVCVDRDLSTTNPSAPCDSTPISVQPQGAPIAVTSVVPRYTRTGDGVTARYEITLRNLKSGLIIAPGPLSKDACNLENLKRAEYGVALLAANLSTIPLDCGFTNEHTVRFTRNEAIVVCSYTGKQLPGTLLGGANYEAPLIITAQYYYIDRITSQLEVTR